MTDAAFTARLVEFDARLNQLGVAPGELPNHLFKAFLRGELLFIVLDYGSKGSWHTMRFVPSPMTPLSLLFEA